MHSKFIPYSLKITVGMTRIVPQPATRLTTSFWLLPIRARLTCIAVVSISLMPSISPLSRET